MKSFIACLVALFIASFVVPQSSAALAAEPNQIVAGQEHVALLKRCEKLLGMWMQWDGNCCPQDVISCQKDVAKYLADKTAAEAVTAADASLAEALQKLISLEQTTYGSPGGAVGIVVEPGTPTSH